MDRLTGKKFLHCPKPGYWYVRVKGKYLGRITADPHTEEFDRQYWAIRNGAARAAKLGWAGLIKSYRSSDRWQRLSPRTRADYERVLLFLEKNIGARDVRAMQRKDVIEAQAANAHRVRFANYIVQVLSVLCEHAIDIGWRQDNPAKGVRLVKVAEAKKRAHTPWTDEAVAKFRQEAGPLPRLIFEIGVGSVQRPSDWTKLTWGDFDGTSLHLTQGKTGVALVIPCTQELRAALGRARDSLGAVPHPSRPILTNQTGDRLTYPAMAKIMLDERRRLGVEAYDLHALRYRGVMELAFAGCTDDEIMAYSGHASKDMVRKYAGQARQKTRALQALEKRQ